MCDTPVAAGEVIGDGSVILAKNSDCHPSKAQSFVYISGAQHEPSPAVRCTRIEVPRILETREVLPSKVFWA
jgi:hypothetical protein